jgi:hypothetical protein
VHAVIVETPKACWENAIQPEYNRAPGPSFLRPVFLPEKTGQTKRSLVLSTILMELGSNGNF